MALANLSTTTTFLPDACAAVTAAFSVFPGMHKALKVYFRAVLAINSAQDTLSVTKKHTNNSETLPV